MKKVKIALMALAMALLIAFPLFDSNLYHQQLMNQVFVNIIVVMGLNFITGLTGQMNLGTAGIFALGAYGSALTCTKLGTPVWLGFPIAIVIGFLIGRGLGYPSLRVKGVYLSLTTIGFSEVVRLILTNAIDFTGGSQGVQNIPFLNLFGFEFNTPFKIYYLYFALTIIMAIAAARIVSSKWGRVFKAIRDNSDAVEACGIDVANLKILAFTMAAVYGCIGGFLYTHMMGYINPTAFNQDLSVNYLVMMMIGGIGSVTGNILGAVMVTLLPEILRFMQNYYWLIFSIITLIFAVFLPYGIVSLFKKSERQERHFDIFHSIKKAREIWGGRIAK
ncbi:branched-chain amino acid ABC transporter permease [Caproiciproducens sp.]